ncbi:MAG: FAD-binding oxidoreductase [Planctomycetia bacterium]
MEIDGTPMATTQPDSIEELGRVVAQCRADGVAVHPVGGGSSLSYGAPVAPADDRARLAVDTTALARVVDYPSEDLTITVEAGIRLGALAEVLRAKGQCLPIDGAFPETATLGGLIATNGSGPRRHAHGTLRDYLIGVDVIDAAGRRVHGGGRVVKNVAGYDFMKMHIGALGTLGVVAQATLKLKPLPEAASAVVCPLPADFDAGAVERLLERVNQSETRPTAVDLLNAAAARSMPALAAGVGEGAAWVLLLCYEESAEGVNWQLHHLRGELATVGVPSSIALPDDDYPAILEQATAWPESTAHALVLKAAVLPSDVGAFTARLQQQLPGVGVVARAGKGVVYAALPTPFDEKLAVEVNRLAADVGMYRHASFVFPKLPSTLRATIPAWGTARHDWTYMRRLKAKLDPTDVLNPGRFPPAAT